MYVAASDGGKYASVIITFKNMDGERCLDSAKPVWKFITNDYALKIKGIDVHEIKKADAVILQQDDKDKYVVKILSSKK